MAIILLGEEIADLCKALTILLRRHGHDVVATANGDQLLDSAAHRTPDLIVMNPTLPSSHGDGLQTCRRLRADPRITTTPILMLSVRTYPAEIKAAQDAGADDYLGKPFDNQELVDRVTALLAPA